MPFLLLLHRTFLPFRRSLLLSCASVTARMVRNAGSSLASPVAFFSIASRAFK